MKKKANSRKWWITFTILFFIFFAIPMFLTIHLYSQVFGVRVDVSGHYYSYLLKNHPDFHRTAASFHSDENQKLQGYFYFYDRPSYKGLIIMAHGMGGGHEGYLPEAEYLSANGYLVFAYDNTGTNESEGKSLIGLSQSVIDLHHALNFVESIPEFDTLPLLLYGHSWGGFAVTAVNNYSHPITAVVSVSGFEKNRNVMKKQGREMVGNAVTFFMPYVDLYERILFGKAATYTGISGLSKTDAAVMLIHSEDDTIVDYRDNFLQYKSEFGQNPRFTFFSLTSHGHNVMSSGEQEKALAFNLDTELMDKVVHFFDRSSLSPSSRKVN